MTEGSAYPYRRILFVCHANTARSVMAEHLLRRRLVEIGVSPEEVVVESGGIAAFARDGSLVSLDTRLVLRDVGIGLSEELGARDLKRGHRHLLDTADLILTMTSEQIDMVRTHHDPGEIPLLTLRAFAGFAGDIDDPAGHGEDVFAAARDEIIHAIEHALPRLVPSAPPLHSCASCVS
ncbi:MAG: hypothetical protein FJ144_17990 [Deltaproteobacteria bacterium]|nr:hypothetical protein [Deltaproteobacteria bacterium]